MPENISELWDKLHTLTATVARIDDKFMLHRAEEREWVWDKVRPMQESIQRIEAAVTTLTKDASSLFSQHDALLREKSQREKEEYQRAKEFEIEALKAKQPLAVIKRLAPVTGFVLACVGIAGVIWQAVSLLLLAWLRAHGLSG